MTKNFFYIINANYYKEISSRLLKGATSYCENNKIDFQVVEVPGALDISSAINIINEKSSVRVDSNNIGYVALGCIIKGETSHYDVVVYESAYGLTELSISKNIILSNSILTVDNYEQALERSKDDESNKGYHAAKACSRLIEIKNGKI